MAEPAFDPYEALGVRRGATQAEIRAAYRERVARYHPDKHRGNPLEELAEAKLVEINRAYRMLCDDRERAAYEGSPATSVSARPPRTQDEKPDPLAQLGTRLLRTVAFVAGAIFLLRFGLVLGRQVLAIFRGLALGVLWLLRLSPIFAIALILLVGMATSVFLRSRKRSR
jgi:DnaJ domain